MATWVPPDKGIHVSVEIDERFISEWLAYGFTLMAAFLDKNLRFEEWLDKHERR